MNLDKTNNMFGFFQATVRLLFDKEPKLFEMIPLPVARFAERASAADQTAKTTDVGFTMLASVRKFMLLNHLDILKAGDRCRAGIYIYIETLSKDQSRSSSHEITLQTSRGINPHLEKFYLEQNRHEEDFIVSDVSEVRAFKTGGEAKRTGIPNTDA